MFGNGIILASVVGVLLLVAVGVAIALTAWRRVKHARATASLRGRADE
jgi:uncharacterized integral membrane protein